MFNLFSDSSTPFLLFLLFYFSYNFAKTQVHGHFLIISVKEYARFVLNQNDKANRRSNQGFDI